MVRISHASNGLTHDDEDGTYCSVCGPPLVVHHFTGKVLHKGANRNTEAASYVALAPIEPTPGRNYFEIPLDGREDDGIKFGATYKITVVFQEVEP